MDGLVKRLNAVGSKRAHRADSTPAPALAHANANDAPPESVDPRPRPARGQSAQPQPPGPSQAELSASLDEFRASYYNKEVLKTSLVQRQNLRHELEALAAKGHLDSLVNVLDDRPYPG